MAPRNPGIVQSDAPLLLADLIRELTLIGPGVGLLGFNDQITPTFIVGARGVTFEAQEPVFAPAEVFSDEDAGVVAAAAIVDTGQLLAGNFDIIANVSARNSSGVQQVLRLVQRNAGDTADIASWPLAISREGIDDLSSSSNTGLKFSMSVLEDERFTIVANVTDATLRFAVWMMVRRRADVT